MSNTSALHYYFPPTKDHALHFECDLCIYGANSGGTIAAIAARKLGLSVVLLEPSRHIGGLSAGGLSSTDIGNKFAIGGLAREFYRRVGAKYGVKEHWRFEPHVAEEVFTEWLAECDITCHFESFLADVQMRDGRIHRITTEHGISVTAKQFIDGTYEGDLMARAGVSFTIGRESNAQYNETLNGSQVRQYHQFDLPVSPYVTEGDPSSGLLPGIDPEPHIEGAGDHRVQAYNFRLCLTNNAANCIPFEKPEDYNQSAYELAVRYCRAGYNQEDTLYKFDTLINDKVDMNNYGGVSSDFIGANYDYPSASYSERERIFQEHVRWIKGLLWFWKTDKSVTPGFQKKFQHWGWCKDEFVKTGGFSHALYVREARRLVSDLVMTEHHCRGTETVSDPAGLAAYTMDSHNCRRVVIDGAVRNEGDVQVHSGPPYGVSYRSIIPKRGECKNLFIPFCLSASHIAFGSIRMEPVYMVLSESAVHAAAIAIKQNVAVQDVPYATLREHLLKAGQVLETKG